MCGKKYNNNNDNNSCYSRTVERGKQLFCSYYDRECVVDESINYDNHNRGDDELIERYNIIVSHLLKAPHAYSNKNWRFFYEEKTMGEPIDDPANVNIANFMVDYPRSFRELIDSILVAISSKYSNIGYCIQINGNDRALYYVTNNDLNTNKTEINGIVSRLIELEYFNKSESRDQYNYIYQGYTISAKGWLYIDELTKTRKEINQGFIAMDFKIETKEISKAFIEAIEGCGYVPQRIDQKEHNNQIVPEIFYEIRRSKFLVVDVTYPNNGAYYEAGYGEALNKQVIICCRQDEFNSSKKPHFDIAQKNTVVWSDLNELKQKLKLRIEATVGLNHKGK
jgi:hypothetical protein